MYVQNTHKWLSNASLFGETEGLLTAAQDQSLNTRNYQRYIIGQQIDSKCRMCADKEETIDHIVSGCEILAKTEYLERHNKAARYLHWNICKDLGIEVKDQWYKHEPETVIHNHDNNITVLWDMPIHTDRHIAANRPDIVIKDSTQAICKIIDMTVPSDRNIAIKELEKKSKYKDLEIEIERMWNMKSEVIPVVIGALGTIKKGMNDNIRKISERNNTQQIQKIFFLGSARIIRKVLSL